MQRARSMAAAALLLVLTACGGAGGSGGPGGGGLPSAPGAPTAATTAGPWIVFFGDSITYGLGWNKSNPGVTPCSPPTHSTGCYADLVTKHFNGFEVNEGLGYSCMETTTTPQSQCSEVPSAAGRFPGLFSYCSDPNVYLVMMFGTNDALAANRHLDQQVTPATFKTDLQDIITGCHAYGLPLDRIVVGQVPYATTPTIDRTLIHEFNTAIAQVAQSSGVRVALTFAPLKRCGAKCFISDGIHPTAMGHRILAAAFERAIAQ